MTTVSQDTGIAQSLSEQFTRNMVGGAVKCVPGLWFMIRHGTQGSGTWKRALARAEDRCAFSNHERRADGRCQ